MNINGAFPSTYLKAADLQGRTVTVTMDHVKIEEVGDGPKPVLYFQGKEKGLVLNKTNSNNIAFIYGPETDHWQGNPIQLFPTMVDFQGKSVEAIRVRGAPRQNGNGHAQQPAAQQPKFQPVGIDPEPAQGGGGFPADFSDSIPFGPDR